MKFTSLKEATRKLQSLAGVAQDGIYGINTANALLALLDPPCTEQGDEGGEEGGGGMEPPAAGMSQYPPFTESQLHKIRQVISVFETGTTFPDYSAVSIYKDGGNGAYRQITYGAHQTTQDSHLDELLEMYVARCKAAGYADASMDVIAGRMPVKDDRSLPDDKEFITALKLAGNTSFMQEAQEELFARRYMDPAYRWTMENGFRQALSLLVIYDSFIHSGGILSFLRNKFAAVPPAAGGDEHVWIEEYVKARRNWLANHSRTILRKTVYRMDTMQQAIAEDNWDLSLPVKANGIVVT